MKKNLYKHPKLYEAFDLHCQQWCEELPTDEELADITFSPTLQEKMRRLLRRQRCGFYVLFGTAGRRVASVLVMLLVSMTIATVSVKALREPVVRFITEVFETFTSILFVNDEPTPADVQLEAVMPAYIPEGYVVEWQGSDGKTMHRIAYYNADTETRLLYTQRRDKDGVLTANTEEIVYHAVSVNGVEGIAYSQKDSTAVMFVRGGYAFTVKGTLAEEELLHIAASIPAN